MTSTTTETREICPECSAPLFPAIDTGELECQACERILRMEPHAGCPYCGANSYYSLAAKNRDKLEGYKCRSCKGEFSDKELTEWVLFLSAVVDGCRERFWGLHRLDISPPPFDRGKIAKDRMDWLSGKKPLAQITDPAHLFDLIQHYALGGAITSQQASEILSKSLLKEYTGKEETVTFRKQGERFYISVKGKEFTNLKCRAGFYCMQILLLNPGQKIEALKVEKFCQDPDIQRWIQDSTLDLNTGGVRDDFHFERRTEKEILEYLERQRELIEASNDPEQTIQLKEDLTEGKKYLEAGTGQFHKRREFSKKDKLAAGRVRRNIGTALKFLRESGATELVHLAARLNRDIAKGEGINKVFSYSPDQNNPIHWVLF